MKQVKRSALAAGVGSTAAFYGVMGVCSLALGAAVTMVATEPPLTCTDPGSQLFPIDIVEAFFGCKRCRPFRPPILRRGRTCHPVRPVAFSTLSADRQESVAVTLTETTARSPC